MAISKKYASRKLLAFIVNDIILVGLSVLLVFISPQLLTPTVMITLLTLIVINGVTYMGGKALEVWAKSKWFRSELVDK